MLSHFLRAKFLVVVIMVGLFVGLALFVDYDARNAMGPKCQVKVYGKCYRDQEVRRLSQYFWVSRELLLIDFAMSLFGEDRLDLDTTDFVTNLIVLRREAERLGIEPTDDEAKEAIRSSPIFALQSWMTDDILVNRILAPRGLSKADLVQLGKDYLSWRKLNDLLAAGNAPVEIEIAKTYTRDHQQFTARLAEFKREDFLAQVEVTDEEIQAYHEENQDDLMSEEMRGIILVRFPAPAEEEGEEITNEQRAQQRVAHSIRVNEIYSELLDQEDQFTEAARSIASDAENPFPLEVEEVPPFAATSPPESLQGQDELLGDLFSPIRGPERDRSVSVPFPQPDGSFLLFQVTSVEEPRPLSLEEASEQIKEALTARRSNLLVNEAATAARAKVLEALDAGQSAEEAADAAGITFQELPPFSKASPPAGILSAPQLVDAALRSSPGTPSDILPLPGGEGYQFLLVEKAELVESPDEESRKSSLKISAASDYRRALFKAWFRQRLAESGVVRSAAGPIEDDFLPAPEDPGLEG